jgi:hypothetical protein
MDMSMYRWEISWDMICGGGVSNFDVVIEFGDL